MENDVLKNKIAPWQETGRWYHIACDSNGTTWTLDQIHCDPLPNLIITGSQYIIPFDDVDHVIIDIKVKVVGTPLSTIDFTTYYGVRLAASPNRYAIRLPDPTSLNGHVDIWIFVVK